MTVISTLCQANEVFKVLRALFFKIFQFFAIAAEIFNANMMFSLH